MRILPRPFTVMFFVFDLRDIVSVTVLIWGTDVHAA
jgi:hypothetical protein